MKNALLTVLAIILIALGFGQSFAEEIATAEQIEFFETQIRPVLAEYCYECHNSADSTEGELALDSRQGVLDGGENGPIVALDQPKKSRLLSILRHEVEGLEMPENGAKLEERVIANFEKWIAMGLPDPRDEPPSSEELSATTSWNAMLLRRKQWWSLQPIQRPETPTVAGVNRSEHPIDRFVAAKLSTEGLQSSEPAEAGVLVRRLYFNLIGLPPGVEDARNWTSRIANANEIQRNEVVEELIDQLLDSPRFGERWARHWMDWIRYAESHGSEGDPEIDNAWVYRDYLIRALNNDVPYDQLVREHLAGDLLASPRVNTELGINESMIGPAHWRMVFHGFAPTDPLDEKVRFIDDQINVFSKAFLGLTVSCARCHDHKFDAISQQDYYALFGILGSCRPGRVVIDLPEKQNRNRDLLVALKPKIRNAVAKDWLGVLKDLPVQLLSDNGPWQQVEKTKSVLHPLFLVRKVLAQSASFDAAWKKCCSAHQESVNQWKRFHSSKKIKHWNLASEADYSTWFPYGGGMPDRPLPAGEFSVATQGDLALTGIYPAGVFTNTISDMYPARLSSDDFKIGKDHELWLRVIGEHGAAVRYVVHDYPRNGTVFPVSELKNEWRWQRFDLAYWNEDLVHIELTSAKDAPLLVKKQHRSWFGIREALVLGKGQSVPTDFNEHLEPIFEAAAANPPHSLKYLVELYRQTIASAVESWRQGNVSDAKAALLDACLRQGLLSNQLASLATAKPLVEEYRHIENEIPILIRVPGLEETVAHDQALYVRGNHKLPGKIVPRRFLEAIDATPYETQLSGRLKLAEDVLRDDNPLSRRVIVNRIWHHLFGQGLVRTPNNFGRLGEKPTHPELLDWMATRFVDDGWSLKKMVRLLVTSQTWQLSSRSAANAQQKDPDNRLVSHATIRRLEAESIRDTLLHTAGELEHRLYGASVKADSPRRSVYLKVVRNSLVPLLRVFDFPEPFASTGRRDVTNVPAQSLALMNDPAIARYATQWAKRLLDNPQIGSDEQRIEQMFMKAFSRKPSEPELDDVLAYLAATRSRIQGLHRERTKLEEGIAAGKLAREKLLDPVRRQLREEAKAKSGNDDSPTGVTTPKPIARWDFESDMRDSVGSLHVTPLIGGHFENGALIVGDKSHVITLPLQQTLKAKTLEAWVQLDNLTQRGGGVMTLQTPDGVYFDSIVYGEKNAGHWLAGSNGFSRTQPFRASQESDVVTRPVHLAISYHDDGQIVGYRDGKPYGSAYQTSGPFQFDTGGAIVGFGVRHLPAGGNRMLEGKIFLAKLYDRALNADEIKISFLSTSWFVTETQTLEALPEKQQQEVASLTSEIALLEAKVGALGAIPEIDDEKAVWSDFASALFTFKEFIYVR
ncbi:MAG: DUF1553 domain-containing protein [Pirellulales bacterium]